MYAVVTLEINKKNIVVPIQWINNFNLSNAANNGVNSSIPLTVFYIDNFDANPNFLLPLETVFDKKEPKCYKVRLKKVFGMYRF